MTTTAHHYPAGRHTMTTTTTHQHVMVEIDLGAGWSVWSCADASCFAAYRRPAAPVLADWELELEAMGTL